MKKQECVEIQSKPSELSQGQEIQNACVNQLLNHKK